MRKDMSKVVSERPRTGAGWRRKGRTTPLVDADDTPLRQRAPPRKTPGSKSLSDNLAPLRRFLESNVGRSWNKVHAEIAENIQPTSTVQKHVLEHVDDFVATRTRMKDDEVYVTMGRFGGPFQPVKDSWALLYVHPKTGKLMRNRHYRTPPPGRAKAQVLIADRRRDLGPLRQAHLFGDGAWWDVVLEANHVRKEVARERKDAAPAKRTPLPFEDVVLARGLSDMTPDRLYGRTGVHAVSARRLTKAERKKLDLP